MLSSVVVYAIAKNSLMRIIIGYLAKDVNVFATVALVCWDVLG